MYPVLFTIPIFGGIPVFTYGLFVALGYIGGILWVKRQSAQHHLNADRIMDLLFGIVIAAVAGGHLTHFIVTDPGLLLKNPLLFFKLWEGGFVFYGGLAFGLAFGLWYIRRHRLPTIPLLDIFAPGMALGHGIGRIGCFMAGCCYGKETHGHPWYAVVFPEGVRTIAPSGLSLYPTQLMEAAGLFFIFGILLLVRKRKTFELQLFSSYVMLYAVLRFMVEQYRGDIARGFVIDPWLSISQSVSIILFLIGMVLYLWRRKKVCHS